MMMLVKKFGPFEKDLCRDEAAEGLADKGA